ncbi:fumarylacetoacetate hydrolase family protein [Bradyrhizobium liaoningense]|uniref:fumarylacetoacetate hydrolase family protein n=1 Tax=Bradyrhizobium liaoningense TaxID=43992 RepID=UPI001BA5CEA1|nr:fumarylacetoacetate hydrolase family protein [Bradyrhizobium liaoningense]MBR0713880.1 fumarylacetoacetate hydrolase family protein [Bradyrhizobium liaoningense]
MGGWKVAIGPQQLPVAAPLLDLYPDSSDISLFRNCTIEVELAVRLRTDLPRREAGTYERSDILDAIENAVLGIEVIGGRFDSVANVSFLSFLADNLGNRAYVVGDSVPLSALSEVNGLDCLVTLDGQPLYQAPASHPAGDPLLPLLAYANAQSDYLGGLKAGQLVTTGSLSGVLPVRATGLLEARISQVGRTSVRFSD